jgi:predicted DNA-binding transcriptional regulator YafY
MPGATKNVMLRTWELLKLIPQREPGLTARDLLQQLEAAGYPVSKKTVERDLVELSLTFPLVADDSVKPFRWRWSPGAKLNLPSVALTEALSLVLAAETLMGLMHRSLLKPLEGRIEAAKHVLKGASGVSTKAGWAEKIRWVPRDLTLKPPPVHTAVLEQIQDALLSDRQLEIHYKSLQDPAPSWRTVNPRMLLLKGSVMYLLADNLAVSGKPADHPVKQYALHRIHDTLRSTSPLVPRLLNLTKYMRAEEHEVGNRRPIRLRLRVSSDLAKILGETRLAANQRMKVTPDGTVKVEAAVRNTPALRRWILGHGPAVEVLGPARLRAAIHDKLKAAAAAY